MYSATLYAELWTLVRLLREAFNREVGVSRGKPKTLAGVS